MSKQTLDWTSFRQRILINKSLAATYAAWTQPGLIQTWFLEKADFYQGHDMPRSKTDDIKAGDHFVWKWNNWDFEEKGEVLEANGKDLVSFTFGAGGVVKVRLRKNGSATELVLIQKDIPTDEKSKKEIFVGCATGWTFWLTNLKAWLEYGITLHATGLKQEETTDLVNS
ncbi:MAG: SRPBCC family protein [Candidatus Cyclobacteriaceae bacterium M3_2C_046]